MAAGTVSAKVRVAHHGRLALVAAESALVGSAAAIATLAAGVAAGVDPGDPQLRVVLALAGILGAGSWWMERREDAASVARAIDRRSGWDGALTTAFEAESAADPSPVAAALARSLAPRIAPGRFLAGESRASIALLAAPCLAAALLAAILEGRTTPSDPTAHGSSRRSSTAASLGRAADARDRALRLAGTPGIADVEADELRALAERAPRIDGTALAELEAELARRERAIENSRSTSPGAGVASEGPDGTMGGRAPGGEGPAPDPMRTPSSPGPDAGGTARGAEGGVGAARWWPERYDGVVERWIEVRRRR